MTAQVLTLRSLRAENEAAFRLAVEEFGDTNPEMRFAFDYEESADFPAYVEKLRLWSEGEGLPDKFVPNTFLVGWVGGAIVGRISIRHALNDFLERVGGHIGYAVVPSQCGRGYATEMLRQVLAPCATLGIERVLVTCDIDNPASRRVIEKNGGIFDGIAEDPALRMPKRRYWIATISRDEPDQAD